MEAKKIAIDEDKLRQIIFESIKKVLNEDLDEAGYDYEKMKSNNAVYAEEEGFQRGQYFCRSNKMEPVVLKYLSMSYFQVIDNEWHHTGKTYKKTNYYAWKKPEYKQIYQANKAKIDSLILQYNAKIEELGPEPSNGADLKARSDYWREYNIIERYFFHLLVADIKSIFGVN